ncbi:MarC family protein [Chromobacterium sp. IIBBL 290-4]|uniref:MarC family protein n=1 Tax=Chromobacterium sp. IIBBL 290-4 TaxID=2953890 RepID=UPI0020B826A6|nr:MarC family protein [Chromobacterium sp. IIBBL 290-4]UTH74036.1 MarC family protein [Chromobacterium sp. IIBBL 290-4]
MQLLSIFMTKFLFVMAALLPIMNPPGLVPIFISMTARNTPVQRRFLARRIALYCALLLVGSMYVGGYVLSFFGVSLPVVQMSGGLLITFAAWRMLNDTPAESSQPSTETAHIDSKAELKQRAFYPLTFPLTVGPGSISVAITIGASLTGSGKGIIRYGIAPLAGSAAILVCSVLVYLCYAHADKLLRYLGQTGSIVFLRLSAFILLCLGVQIMWDGFGELASQWLHDNAALLH